MLKTSGGPPDAESADPLMKLFFVMSTIFCDGYLVFELLIKI
jgi:hypothetical protein